ncbi:MAG TPA: response regulator transcription factor [Anaerolineales bacterium]|nr:response regulator transcription factor [Anaerolineales bacterium]
MPSIKILIADDHPVIRTALASVISREPNMEVVGEAVNGHSAVKMFRKCQPDITLMDLNMPIMDGREAIRAIRADHPDARIIVLTNYDSDEDVKQGLAAGAQGYMLKDASPDQLLDTIRSVFAGEKHVPQHLLDKIEANKSNPNLSPREVGVLRLMMRGKSNRAIGLELGITESTVKSHVKNILIKMSVNDRTQAVTLAVQRGILSLDK